MNLRLVPDDEANAVRELLDEHGLDWYEIAPNRWGISSGEIWLRDDDEHPRAKALLDQFQCERASSARAAYDVDRREGRASFLNVLREDPMRVVVAVLCLVLVLGLVALPVALLG